MVNISPKIKWEVLHRAMASSKVLAEDWHHFERMSMSDPNKSYDYLRGLIDAHLAREDTKANLAARKIAMDKKRGHDGDPAAPAADGKDKAGRAEKKEQRLSKETVGSDQKRVGDRSKPTASAGDRLVEKCFFFNREHFDGGPGCKFDAKSCKFRHEYMSKNEWDQCKEKPPSRPSSPAPRTGRKGRSGGGGNPSFIDPSRCCEEFLRSGRCDLLERDQGCPKLHIKQSELDRENKQRNAAQTKAKINAE